MPRRLGEELSELRIQDNLSNSEIVLRYRTPTTQERLGYENAKAVRKGGRVEDKRPQARQKYGMKILAGFREGDFERMVDGKWTPISSNPDSPNYWPEWKSVIAEQAGDMVEALAIQVFDLPVMIQQAEPEADEETDAEESGEEAKADEDPEKN